MIGEAAAKISTETRDAYPDIPWQQIAALRNVLVHAYFGIDWPEVWQTASVRCPVLRDQIDGILSDVKEKDSDGDESTEEG